jgi:hypothetical protein
MYGVPPAEPTQEPKPEEHVLIRRMRSNSAEMIIEEDEESEMITEEEKADIREKLLSDFSRPAVIPPYEPSTRRLKKSRSFRTIQEELQLNIKK